MHENIEKAVVEMARCNNCLPAGQPLHVDALKGRLDAFLTFYCDDYLWRVDQWLGSLTKEQLSIAVDGEQSETRELCEASGPEGVHEMLDKIFDGVL